MLTGDGNILEAAAEMEEFPANITPFSETPQVFFVNLTPQKLRIRCNGRSAAQFGSGAAGDFGLPPFDDDDQFMEQGIEFVTWKRKRKRTSRCSSATRKRRRLERLEHFMEGLVNQMMEKQEEMHKRLIEMVQDSEKERIAKEDAWKQREFERITSDEEIRAQEISRSLAVINLVQNLLGSDVQVPQPSPILAQPVATVVPSSPGHDHQYMFGDVQVPKPAPVVAQPMAAVAPPSTNHDHQYVEENDNLQKDAQILECSPTFNRSKWLEAEVQALIELRASLETKFCRPVLSGHGIWKEISLGMNRMGYDRTGSKCKEKWDNLTRSFKRAITSGRKRPANAKLCHYFDQLELLRRSVKENNNTLEDTEIDKLSATPTDNEWRQTLLISESGDLGVMNYD